MYYSHRNYPFFAEDTKAILKILPTKSSAYTPKFLAAFLKSSFLFWYLLNKVDDIDLFLPQVYNTIRVPKVTSEVACHAKIAKTVESIVDKIMKLEQRFLVVSQGLSGDKLTKSIEEHNAKVDYLAYAIDRWIFELLGLSPEEIITVETHLRLQDFYLPRSEVVQAVIAEIRAQK